MLLLFCSFAVGHLCWDAWGMPRGEMHRHVCECNDRDAVLLACSLEGGACFVGGLSMEWLKECRFHCLWMPVFAIWYDSSTFAGSMPVRGGRPEAGREEGGRSCDPPALPSALCGAVNAVKKGLVCHWSAPPPRTLKICVCMCH